MFWRHSLYFSCILSNKSKISTNVFDFIDYTDRIVHKINHQTNFDFVAFHYKRMFNKNYTRQESFRKIWPQYTDRTISTILNSMAILIEGFSYSKCPHNNCGNYISF